VHDVLSILLERHRAGSRPGARDDGHRVALVIEGGGMRGVVSSAMCAVIEREGLLDAFDLVAGASAGALNGAALIGGVADGCTREYAGALTDRRFINPARLLLGRAVIDVRYVLDYAHPDTLDEGRHARALQSPIALHAVACDIATARAVDLTGMADQRSLHDALLASSRLPWIGGEPVALADGRRFLDGGLVEPVPLDTALAAGATHVVALLTRPAGAAVPAVGDGLGDRLAMRRLRALNPALVEAYRARPGRYAATVERVRSEPNVLGIFLPEGSPVPSRLERNAERLRAAADLATAAAEAALQPSGT
jgi:predicted patatin/cPLA2 family phospholipase